MRKAKRKLSNMPVLLKSGQSILTGTDRRTLQARRAHGVGAQNHRSGSGWEKLKTNEAENLRPRGGAKASAPEWESGGQRGRKKHGALFGGRGEESFICGSLPGSSCERRERRETERRETERRERERGERDERDMREI